MGEKLISIVVPIYNEALNVPILFQEINRYTENLPYKFELLFVDDGSTDNSSEVVSKLTRVHSNVHYIQLSRNFGKEPAVSAGLHAAHGDAAIILDADLQHPPKLMPDFIDKWESGADVVVGIKRYSDHESKFKRFSSSIFYKILGAISHVNITPHASDYRLVDRRVMDAFRDFSERNRMTRGLIDWLGFRREYIDFVAPPRKHGERRYTYRKLVNLAVDNFTSYSLLPLKLAGYIGVFILILSGTLGIFVYAEQILLSDPLHLHVTGTAMLALMLLLLVGIVLACLGLISLYIANIHNEVTNRPLYVIRSKSRAISEEAME